MRINPILKLLGIGIYVFQGVIAFFWLSGWYEVNDDMLDGGLRALVLVGAPLGIVLWAIADRQQ